MRIVCPGGHALSVPDERVGTKVRCPKCKVLFRAVNSDEAPAKPKPKAAAPKAAPSRTSAKRPVVVEPDDDEDEDDDSPLTPEERKKQRQREKKERLRQVTIGLLIHLGKMWALAVAIFFVVIWNNFDAAISTAELPTFRKDAELGLSPTALDLFKMFRQTFAALTMISAGLLPIAGAVAAGFGCTIPKKSECRATILASFVFEILAFLAAIFLPFAALNAFGSTQIAQERFFNAVLGGLSAFSLLALFTFGLYLRQLAQYLHKTTLASQALNLVTWLMVLTLTFPVVLYAVRYLSPIFVGLVGSAVNVGLMFLIALVWFAAFNYIYFMGTLKQINDLRGVIEDLT